MAASAGEIKCHGRPAKQEGIRESEHIKANITPKIRRYSGVVKTNRVQGTWRYGWETGQRFQYEVNAQTLARAPMTDITDRPNWKRQVYNIPISMNPYSQKVTLS
jgi:hypothetical protein